MARILLIATFLLTCLLGKTQNFNGQWRGSFTDLPSGRSCEYVLEFEINGTDVSGYSYTYFTEGIYHYYTICRLSGTIDPNNKTITATEVEKVKSNTPKNFDDCLQSHTLKYDHKENMETLEGRWKPAPGFSAGTCGYGTTTLSRKIPENRTAKQIKKAPVRLPLKTTTAPQKTPAKKSAASPVPKPMVPRPQTRSLQKDTTSPPASPSSARPPATTTQPLPQPPAQVTRRAKNLLKVIDVNTPDIHVEFYDNGEIDHDTITVYFNGKRILPSTMLTRKPIKLTLTVLPNQENELIMYADNLGDVPPNTALMIVYAGEERYEVRITSDEQNNGAVRFHLKTP